MTIVWDDGVGDDDEGVWDEEVGDDDDDEVGKIADPGSVSLAGEGVANVKEGIVTPGKIVVGALLDIIHSWNW